MKVKARKHGPRLGFAVQCVRCERWKGEEFEVTGTAYRLAASAVPDFERELDLKGHYICEACTASGRPFDA